MRIKRHAAIFGALVICAIVLITFQSSLEIGFFAEDYKAVDFPARRTFSEYLQTFFDPSVPAGWYRPVQGIQFAVEYYFFGSSGPPYHLAQILFHLGNSLLLYVLVGKVTRRWQIGFIAATVYVGLPAVRPGVFWISVTDPYASFFYLLTLALWLRYLQTRRAMHYGLTLALFITALLSKEFAVTIPMLLVLADRLLVPGVISWKQLALRYLPFVLIMIPYAYYFIQRGSTFSAGNYAGPYSGLGIGPHIISNLLYYVALIAHPWDTDGWARFIALALVAFAVMYLVVVRRQRRIAFVAAFVLLAILPVLPLPFVGVRYLYLGAMASGIFVAVTLDALARAGWRRRAATWVEIVGVSLIVYVNATATAEAARGMTGFVRESRLPFRPIFQKHPSFPPDTYLYFVNSPMHPDFVSGMMSLRYGSNVLVEGTENNKRAGLRVHRAAYVYVFDEQNRIQEQAVNPDDVFKIVPEQPIEFTVPIRLEGYEVARKTVARGESIVILLYWRATAPVRSDYTVFAHLVNVDGEMVGGADSEPRAGKARTSSWRPGELLVDGMVIPVTSETGPGEYRLEMGLYYLPTMERILARGANGQVVDRVTIESFVIR